jgi:urease accessory protein
MFVDAQEPPWKVIRAFAQPGGGALVHLHNVSGGVLAGDRLSLDIDVGPRAAVQVTSTGATRLYRHREGTQDSEQRVTIAVREKALLEYLPDPLIPFAGSRHSQDTSITLDRGATLFWWEVTAPGRLAAGERFAYDRLRVKSSVRASGRLVLQENFRLDPKQRPLASIARLGEYTHMASFYAFQEGRPPAEWRELEDSLNQVAIRRSSGTVWGASTLASDGVIVRGLSMGGRDISEALLEFWRVARRTLTGEDPVPPRKVY